MATFPWKKLSETLLQKTKIFDLYAQRMRFPDGKTEADFFFIKCPAWTNVVALTDSGEIVLVKQFRHGIQEFCLETPGGLVDEGEDDILLAAQRELEEETGYVAREILPLGEVFPNPAMLNNRCTYFLALGVQKTKPQELEATEDISVEVLPLSQVRTMIENGNLKHSLLYTGLLLALIKYPERMSSFWSPKKV